MARLRLKSTTQSFGKDRLAASMILRPCPTCGLYSRSIQNDYTAVRVGSLAGYHFRNKRDAHQGHGLAHERPTEFEGSALKEVVITVDTYV